MSTIGEIPLPGRRSRAIELHEYLRSAILARSLLPGVRLKEEEIAELASVSRTPVREAIRQLETEGLVRRDGVGIVVAQVSTSELREVCEVREVLEGMACRLAAQMRSEMDLLTLEHLADAYCSAIEDGDTARIVEVNNQFHSGVWRMASNSYLADQLVMLRSRIQGIQSTTLNSHPRQAETIREHTELVNAIRKQDGDQAEAIGRRHFRAAMALRVARMTSVA